MGQTFSEKITKEMAFEKKSESNAIIVANINGDVNVRGYEGDKVLVEVSKSVYAKTNERLERGKKEVQLGVIDRADTLIFFVEGGCNHFGKKYGRDGDDSSGWGYNWNCNGRGTGCHEDYDYKLSFSLKVPVHANLVVSTVNDGTVTVQNMKGAVDASNVNGSIKLSNLVREVKASTINGDLDVDYSANPAKASRFYSLNGDINAYFQKGLGANLTFESFNGNLYTNVPELESLPLAVLKEPTDQGIRYKINGNRYKIGKGGVDLDFETFNGNAYVKEK